MNKPTIIALSGYAGSGKDEVFRIIQKHIPEARRYAFADALKEDLAEHQRTTVENINQNKAHYRTLLQSWGQGMRAVNPKYWINKVAARIVVDRPALAVITDMRYPNEAEWARNFGGIAIRVTRPSLGPANGHESESALDGHDFDRYLYNDGSLEELEAKVECIVKSYNLLSAKENNMTQQQEINSLASRFVREHSKKPVPRPEIPKPLATLPLTVPSQAELKTAIAPDASLDMGENLKAAACEKAVKAMLIKNALKEKEEDDPWLSRDEITAKYGLSENILTSMMWGKRIPTKREEYRTTRSKRCLQYREIDIKNWIATHLDAHGNIKINELSKKKAREIGSLITGVKAQSKYGVSSSSIYHWIKAFDIPHCKESKSRGSGQGASINKLFPEHLIVEAIERGEIKATRLPSKKKPNAVATLPPKPPLTHAAIKSAVKKIARNRVATLPPKAPLCDADIKAPVKEIKEEIPKTNEMEWLSIFREVARSGTPAETVLASPHLQNHKARIRKLTGEISRENITEMYAGEMIGHSEARNKYNVPKHFLYQWIRNEGVPFCRELHLSEGSKFRRVQALFPEQLLVKAIEDGKLKVKPPLPREKDNPLVLHFEKCTMKTTTSQPEAATPPPTLSPWQRFIGFLTGRTT